MPVTPADIRNKYNQARSSKGARTAAADHGGIKRILPLGHGQVYKLYRTVVGNVAQYDLLLHNFDAPDLGRPPYGPVTEVQAAQDADVLERLCVGHHTQAKNDPRWQTLYGRAQRPLNFIDATGNLVSARHWTYPCHYCGLVLPEELIQVDHRQPQAHPAVAVLKCLHALGHNYTTAPGQGQKTTQLANIAANNVGALQMIRPNARPWDPWQSAFATNAAKQQRYTITNAGKTFLSICCMFWGEKRTVEICLNSILNLVPSCAICNGAAGKGSLTHAA